MTISDYPYYRRHRSTTQRDRQGSVARRGWFEALEERRLLSSLLWSPVGDDVGWNYSSANWIDQSTLARVTFHDGDNVLFDDSGSTGNPGIFIRAGGVAPGSTTFDVAGDRYVLNDGPINGDGPLAKNGGGRVTIWRTVVGSAYSGDTFVNGGTLAVTSTDCIPDTSAVTVAAGATLLVGANGSDTAGEVVGSLAGSGRLLVEGQPLTTGGNNADTLFDGLIESPSSVALIKTGTGVMTLGGTQPATGHGNTWVVGGTLVLAKPAGVLALPGGNPGGAYGEVISVFPNGTVRWAASEQLFDGNRIGCGGALELGTNTQTTSEFNISGRLAVQLETSGGQISTPGNVNINGSTLDLSGSAPGTTYTLINKTGSGAVIGTFAGLPEGASVVVGGAEFQITYHGGDGNDVVLNALTQQPTLLLTAANSVYNAHAYSGANATVIPSADIGAISFTYYAASDVLRVNPIAAPADAGSYRVVAHIEAAPGYTAADSSPVTFTIGKADALIHVMGFTGVYDATFHGATGTASGVGSVDLSAQLSLVGSFKDAPGGTARWAFSGGTNYHDASGSVSISIAKALLTGIATTQDALNIAKQGTFTIEISSIVGLQGSDTVSSVFSSALFSLSIGSNTYLFAPTVSVDATTQTVRVAYTLKAGTASADTLRADLLALDAADGTVSTSAARTPYSTMWIMASSLDYLFTDDFLTRLFSSK